MFNKGPIQSSISITFVYWQTPAFSYADYSLDGKSHILNESGIQWLIFLSFSPHPLNSGQEITVRLQQFRQRILKWEAPAVICRQSADQQHGPEHVPELFLHESRDGEADILNSPLQTHEGICLLSVNWFNPRHFLGSFSTWKRKETLNSKGWALWAPHRLCICSRNQLCFTNDDALWILPCHLSQPLLKLGPSSL